MFKNCKFKTFSSLLYHRPVVEYLTRDKNTEITIGRPLISFDFSILIKTLLLRKRRTSTLYCGGLRPI